MPNTRVGTGTQVHSILKKQEENINTEQEEGMATEREKRAHCKEKVKKTRRGMLYWMMHRGFFQQLCGIYIEDRC